MSEPEIKFDYADVGEVRLHYATAGKGERLVVLLHGFPEFWYSWRHQVVALSDKYTVVAPDIRGFNLSDKPPKTSDYDGAKLVGDITGLIRHFGRENAAVLGHDWGASVAWMLAMRHPEYLWKLGALQVPPIPVWRKNQTFRQFCASWYMFFFQLPALPEFVFTRKDFRFPAEALRTSTAEEGVFTDAEIDKYKEAWSQPGTPSAMINYYRANILKRMVGKQSEPRKIQVPTLFIYGEKDTAVLPPTVAGVGEMIDAPFTELRVPNSGHWVQQEAAGLVTKTLRDFLAD